MYPQQLLPEITRQQQQDRHSHAARQRRIAAAETISTTRRVSRFAGWASALSVAIALGSALTGAVSR